MWLPFARCFRKEIYMSRSFKKARRGGFSLIELVIVVVIIGIIAAIAIPRMSRGTAGAGDSALSGNLTVLRNSIELFASEHGGKFPGEIGGASDTPEKQLTQYSDIDGKTSETRTGAYIYGPYIRKIPPITVGSLKADNTKNALFKTGTSDTVETTPTAGWLYNKTTGSIKANVPDSDTDQTAKLYNTY
jgi:prepilin-type N-terminal cleavage/methylation domain-containing protein